MVKAIRLTTERLWVRIEKKRKKTGHKMECKIRKAIGLAKKSIPKIKYFKRKFKKNLNKIDRKSIQIGSCKQIKIYFGIRCR